MCKLLAVLFLLCVVVFGLVPNISTAQSPPDRKRLLTALYELERASTDFLSGKVGEGQLNERVAPLSKSEPGGEFAGMDKGLAKAIAQSWRDWQRARKPENMAHYLAAIDRAKLRYSPGFQADVPGFWKALDESLQLKLVSPAEQRLLSEVGEDADWLSQNLTGTQISPEGLKSFIALARALRDYQVTQDPKLLEAIASDIRIKMLHCNKTQSRADKPTEFNFDTIDESNQAQAQWIVFAAPERFPADTQRVGNPSTPVTGSLIAGRYWFFAVRGGQQSCHELHTVSEGKTDPPTLILKQCQRP